MILTGAAVGLLVISLFADRRMVLLAVLPLSFATWRVPVAPQGLSVADVILLLAVLVAVSRGLRLSSVGRAVLSIILTYQALLLLPVVAHPTIDAIADWGHRLFLMGGAVLVGSELAHGGNRRTALRAFLLGCAVFAAVSIYASIASSFAPAYPLGVNKNHAGKLLAIGAMVMYAVGRDVFDSARMRTAVGTTVILGLVATQSRGAWLGLGVALVVWSFYSRPSLRVSLAMIATVIGGGIYVVSSLLAESERENARQTSSLESRQYFEQVALDFFADAPLLGQGIRYYLNPEFEFPAPLSAEGDARPSPHNVVVEALSEAGLVGLLALALLIGGVSWILYQQKTRYAMLALSSLLGNFVHGFVDIYWVAGSLTVPWLLVGLAVGRTALGVDGAESRGALRRMWRAAPRRSLEAVQAVQARVPSAGQVQR
ncbi:O-antigen ligase family protein [Blastococcus sp. SYSU DS0541]